MSAREVFNNKGEKQSMESGARAVGDVIAEWVRMVCSGHVKSRLVESFSVSAAASTEALPGFIVGASEWLQSIWDDRDTFVDKPSLILWGAKDIAFRTKELERWKTEFSQCEAHVFADCGHFVAEEAPHRVLPLLQQWMSASN